MSQVTEDILEEALALRRSNPFLTWDDVCESLGLSIHSGTFRNYLMNYRKTGKVITHSKDTRKTPMLEDKFNWSFLNNFWNAGLVLTEYERQPWHHPKEKRDRQENTIGYQNGDYKRWTPK